MLQDVERLRLIPSEGEKSSKGGEMKKNSTRDLSRRSFLTSAAAVASVGALAGFTGCAQQAPEDSADAESAESGIEWSDEADVVVIGYGNAGIGAAKAMLDNGGDVIVLEKAPESEAGGSLSCNGGNWTIVSQEAIVNGSLGTIGDQVAEAINEEGPVFGDWLEECGIEWKESTNSSGQATRHTDNGMLIWEAAHAYFAQQDGFKVLFESPCVELVKDEQGAIIGAAVERDGDRQYYKARKGVVIATGCYASNPDFIQGHHYACLPYTSGTSPYNTGDGMVLAAKAGARAFQDLSLAIEFGPMSARRASEELGTAMPISYSEGIMVNGKGKRFMSESNLMDHNKSTEPLLQIKSTNRGGKEGNWGNGFYNLPAWVIFDEATFTSSSLGRPFGRVMTYDIYTWSDDNQAELEKGWIERADTIDELAAKLNSKNSMTGEDISLDAEGLKATIDEYNGFVSEGVDPLGKKEEHLIPVGDGPYYAIEVIPSVMYTNNGISVNDEMQVTNWEGQPIPRLYAVGDAASRQRTCRICMPGNIVTGAMAARHAMDLESWDA